MPIDIHDLTRQRRRPNKSASLRIFFFIPFFLLFLSINVATGMSHVTCRLKQNASTAAENFDKQAFWAFHFAVIYGLAILQIRHLSELYISNWRLSPRACRTRPRRSTRKSLSIGRKRKNDGRGNGEQVVPCFRRSQSITKDSIQFFESVNYREHTIHEYQGMIHESDDNHVEHGERTFTPCGRNCFRCIVPL